MLMSKKTLGLLVVAAIMVVVGSRLLPRSETGDGVQEAESEEEAEESEEWKKVCV